MKKLLIIAFLGILLFPSCSNDDWMDEFNQLQTELESIKNECANQKLLIEALQKGTYIVGIEQKEDSYTIKFSDGQSITLTNGKTPLINIGENGNWFIDGKDSGKPSYGADGKSPEVSIGKNGNWFINGEDTGIKASGSDGKDGLSIKSIIDNGDCISFEFNDGSIINVEKKPVILKVKGTWCSIGTSISWYNDHPNDKFTKGYQTRVMEKIKFDKFINLGVDGGTILSLCNNLTSIPRADYYTIEHGINDWGKGTAVGNMDDFMNAEYTFYGYYRQVLDYIYNLNPKAKIILCTPRKGYGFGGYLPDHWYDANKKGNYLEEYANAIEDIADYMSLPVADFFRKSQANQQNLKYLSIDVALHPNDAGYQLMANVLTQTFYSIVE